MKRHAALRTGDEITASEPNYHVERGEPQMRIRISWENGEAFGVLNDTPNARKLLSALPCSSTANT
jgi:hypothetical protein